MILCEETPSFHSSQDYGDEYANRLQPKMHWLLFFFFFLIFRAFIFHLQRSLHNLWLIVQLENFLPKVKATLHGSPELNFFLTFLNLQTFTSTHSSSTLFLYTAWRSLSQPQPWEIKHFCLSVTASINNCSYWPHLLSANFAWTLTSKPTLLITCIVHQNLVKHFNPLQTYYRLYGHPQVSDAHTPYP